MKPSSLTADRPERMLTVTWEDGHVSRYPFPLLRAGCPCAECRGGHDKMGDTPDPAVFSQDLPDSFATRLRNLLPVGSYAVSPQWEDGHDYGIFHWGYLRALCPCPACRQK